MTEQEYRIEEMENICYGTGHNRDTVPDIVKYIFIALDNAGYRKAEDVMKEIFNELLQYEESVDVECDGLHDVVTVENIKFVAEKYGITL